MTVYDLTQQQPFGFRPEDIWALEAAEEYWVFDYFGKQVFSRKKGERYEKLTGDLNEIQNRRSIKNVKYI